VKALDLFCGAGGAAMGLSRAGFDVTGVDIKPQMNFPFKFIQANAMEIDFRGFDFVWASPPCQRYSMAGQHKERHPDLIDPIRQKLKNSGVPFVIENVIRAPLVSPTTLCGSMFGLGVWRHRIFEPHGFTIEPLNCEHHKVPAPIDVTGTGGYVPGRINPRGGNSRKPKNMAEACKVMGIDWMTRKEITQAIPPAYSEYIAKQFLDSKGESK
jgi:DNA (cytosine-5)-methyltransferase 1